MPNQAEEPPEGEGITCPGCAEPNPPDADFCTACGRPLSATSALDPLKTIRSEGFLFRQATGGRPSRLVLAGTWLVVLPGVLISALEWRQVTDSSTRLWLVAAAVLGGLLLYRSTRNYLTHR
jgi:hypothetical protein